MSEPTHTDPILAGGEPAVKPDEATVCQTCGIPQVPCPRCTPAPKVLPEKKTPPREPGVVIR